MIDKLRKLFFYGYVLMLLGIGASGICIARWELTHVFSIDLAQLAPRAQATMLNQYRFLKSAEFSFGLFCFLARKRIFTNERLRRSFVAMVFTGVGARVLSLIVDGIPHWAFLGFTLLESITGALMLVTRDRRLPSRIG